MRPDDPMSLTPEERLRELAGILAAAVLRVRSRPASPADLGQHPGRKNLAESGADGLELPRQTVLSVHTG